MLGAMLEWRLVNAEAKNLKSLNKVKATIFLVCMSAGVLPCMFANDEPESCLGPVVMRSVIAQLEVSLRDQ